MSEDKLVYVACDYSATGEGHSMMTLITRAYPITDDYVKPSGFSEDGEWQYNSETKNTPDERALREFANEFGSYFAQGAEVLSREEFFHRYERYVPAMVYKATDPDSKHGQPPGFNWKSSLHMNFS